MVIDGRDSRHDVAVLVLGSHHYVVYHHSVCPVCVCVCALIMWPITTRCAVCVCVCVCRHYVVYHHSVCLVCVCVCV